MSPAETELVEPDPGRAREFLNQAKGFLSDADEARLGPESSVILYWQACVTAMDAVLTHVGRRVTSGTHGHAARIGECRAHLGGGYNELMDRLDEWRRERGDVSYRAARSSDAIVAAIQGDTADLIAAAEQFMTR